MLDKPKISIIGPGVVGSALAKLARQAGYRIAAVAGGSDRESAIELARDVEATPFEHLAEAAAAGDLVLLTVRDQALGPVCEQLAASGGLAKKPIVAHCCGAIGSDVLTAARQVGCGVGSMHPLQSFPDVESALARLPGTYCFIEGDPEALAVLEPLVRALGGHPVKIDPAVKPLYHAAAVMGANYITTMLDAALELLQQTGLDRNLAREAIGPLVRATVENTLAKDTAQALTGPIARGDIETLKRHLSAMEKMDAIRKLYCAVGLKTVEIALAKGTVDKKAAQAMQKLLRA